MKKSKEIEYKQVRQKALERDVNRCQLCGIKLSPGIREVHHIFSRRAYPNLICEIDNLISLCQRCHQIWHIDLKDYKNWFIETYPERYKNLMSN